MGFERAGMRCVWQVEIDPYCRKVLAKHWPDVPKWDDVRTFTGEGFERPDVICGGFPCQPVSHNGHQEVEKDARWLWPYFFQAICNLRPRFVVLENVSGLLIRGCEQVFGDLASIGYDVEWESVQAGSFGAPHRRERVFAVAYPSSWRREASQGVFSGRTGEGFSPPERRGVFNRGASGRLRVLPDGEAYRVAYGLPDELAGLKAAGNAVVPQVAEWIGRRLMEAI